jgi:hypothetical protein
VAWIYGKIIKQMAWSFCNSSRHFLCKIYIANGTELKIQQQLSLSFGEK